MTSKQEVLNDVVIKIAGDSGDGDWGERSEKEQPDLRGVVDAEPDDEKAEVAKWRERP